MGVLGAADVAGQAAREDEDQQVYTHRYERFCALGFTAHDAELLAAAGVSHHEAQAMLRDGCTHANVLRIVL